LQTVYHEKRLYYALISSFLSITETEREKGSFSGSFKKSLRYVSKWYIREWANMFA